MWFTYVRKTKNNPELEIMSRPNYDVSLSFTNEEEKPLVSLDLSKDVLLTDRCRRSKACL